jgi:hypothetical protein
MPAGVLLGDLEGQVSCAKGLFRAPFFGPEWSNHLVDKPLVEMSPGLIDELAARILQFILQLNDNGLRADANC